MLKKQVAHFRKQLPLKGPIAATQNLRAVPKNPLEQTPKKRTNWQTVAMKNPPILTSLRNAFFTGILLILPALITLLAITYLFHLTTGFIPPIIEIFYKGPVPPGVMLGLKTLGLLLLIASITTLGTLANQVFFKKILQWGESLLLKLPLIQPIYKGVKQISEIFQGGKVNLFQNVVLVEYPKEGSYVPAFLTAKAGPEIQQSTGINSLVGVYIPTTPNPTSGFLLYIPKEKILPVDMTSSEAMTLIMSGGVAQPHKPTTKNTKTKEEPH
jgi:uncharacterized membrane protein